MSTTPKRRTVILGDRANTKKSVSESYSNDLSDDYNKTVTKDLGPVDELDELKKNPFTYIRKKIRDQVADSLWLDELQNIYNELEKKKHEKVELERCAICTLPHGSCKHTSTWIAEKEEKEFEAKVKNALEKEIDDVLDIIGDEEPRKVDVKIEEKVKSEIDCSSMKWYQLEQRLSDKIGSEYVCLSAPPPRGWHTTTFLKNKFVVVYGGLRFRGKEIPQPFVTAPKKNDIQCQGGIFVYDVENMSWHQRHAKKGAVEPLPRYGHCACPLDSHRMIIFGGRISTGQVLNDLWIYDVLENRWEQVLPDPRAPQGSSGFPPPRVFSDMACQQGSIYLFGGTDGFENFGDLWVLRKVEELEKDENTPPYVWERVIAVGPTPCPRYGHRLVALHGSPSRLMVIGGCSVSPQSETSLTYNSNNFHSNSFSSLGVKETQELLKLTQKVQDAYLEEGLAADLAGRVLLDNMELESTRNMLRKAANVTGRMQMLESSTREAELELLQALKHSQASRTHASMKARHFDPTLDIHFLGTVEMCWRPPDYPRNTQHEKPSARIFFGAMISGDYLIVTGGAKPTANKYSVVDADVHILDLRTMRWTVPRPLDSSEFLKVPLQIARTDVTRAKKNLDLQRQLELSMALPRGMKSVQLLQKENIVEICQWRLNMLLKEQESFADPPTPRFGASLTCLGQRGLYFGGWGEETLIEDSISMSSLSSDKSVSTTAHDSLRYNNVTDIINKKSLSQPLSVFCSMIIDLEDNYEKLRRESDEFTAKVEREKSSEDAATALKDIQSAYELRSQLEMEKANEHRERHAMMIEDMISAVPPLSKPLPVKIVGKNHHTVWLTWDRYNTNADNFNIDENSVSYFVYMKNSFHNYLVEDRVLVTPLPLDQNQDQTNQEGNNDEDDDDELELGDGRPVNSDRSVKSLGSSLTNNSSLLGKNNNNNNNKKVKQLMNADGNAILYPGEIIKTWKDGYFDVAYDDGTFEKRVKRDRLRLQENVYCHENALIAKISSLIALFEKAKSKENSNIKDKDDKEKLNLSKMLQRRLFKKDRNIQKRKALLMKLNPFVEFKTYNILSELLNLKCDRTNLMSTISNTGELVSNDNLPVLPMFPTMEMSDNTTTNTTNSKPGTPLSSRKPKTPKPSKTSKAPLRKITVLPSNEWTLVYSGKSNNFEVTNLIPSSVLERESDITVEVTFVIQTLGREFPIYEHSQLSDPVSCVIGNLPLMEKEVQNSVKRDLKHNKTSEVDDDSDLSDEDESFSTSIRVSEKAVPDDKKGDINKPSLVSKVRKQVMNTIINNQMVQIHKQGYECYSYGIGNDYI